jgi:hypothetical protein
MTTEIAMRLSGFLFLFILVSYFTKMALGNGDYSDYDSDAELQKINRNLKKIKVSIVVAFLHHASVIILPVMLFIAFSPYNKILAIVWTIFRIGEGLILIYNEKFYWGLLNVASQYSVASDSEKKSLSDTSLIILKTKYSRFTLGMFFWSIGTFALSIVLVTSGVVPVVIGWLGIFAGISVGFYNGILLAKHTNFVALSAIGGLSAILFEVILGGRLLFYSHIIP